MELACPRCLSVNRVPPKRLADGPVCGKCRARLLPAEPIALADANFDRFVEKSDMPVLVDFWADWCPPCRQMAPVLHDVARRRTDIRVAKVDTVSAASLAVRFGIRSIPTLVLLLRGKELARLSGAMPAPQLLHWLDQSLASLPGREAS